jgi:heterodisulfide reductase subunit D
MAQSDYSFLELLQTGACTGCSLCVDVCPAVSARMDGRLSGLYRLQELRKIMGARAGILQRLCLKKRPSKDQLKEFSETVYRCTLCGGCEEACPTGISLRDIWLSLRQDLVHSGSHPGEVETIHENTIASHNVFNEDNQERADWVEDMKDPPDHGYIKEKADVVYFTGCVASYYPMVQKIPMALARILDAAKVDFTVLGSEEWCCGFPLLSAGLRDKIGEVIDHNMEAVRKKGARKVLFACPSCYQMWKEHYPPEFDIFHVTQFLRELISEGSIELKELDLTVTYHDPCDLGRGCNEYEAPRDVIRFIPGVRLVEMEHNREDSLCCGGGGNLEMFDPGLSSDIARNKIEEVIRTGAHTVVTSCQQCVRVMQTYVRRNKIDLEVIDIVELIQKVLK